MPTNNVWFQPHFNRPVPRLQHFDCRIESANPLRANRQRYLRRFRHVVNEHDYVIHLVLPIACLTYGGLAYISRQMRGGMLEVIRQDYIRTAYAKGASKPRVILIHALRNSLFPIITLLANLLPFLVGGSVIIETIFQIPGMGWLAYQAVTEREYELVMATLLLSAVLTLFGILLSDILYALVDPRVSFEARR